LIFKEKELEGCPDREGFTMETRRISLAGKLALATFMLTSICALNVWAQSYQVIYNFGGAEDGANPYAGLVFDNEGNLYGTTENGGVPDCLAPDVAPSSSCRRVEAAVGAKRSCMLSRDLATGHTPPLPLFSIAAEISTALTTALRIVSTTMAAELSSNLHPIPTAPGRSQSYIHFRWTAAVLPATLVLEVW
jgi:hypothetical protein